jgi:hypothetical protein
MVDNRRDVVLVALGKGRHPARVRRSDLDRLEAAALNIYHLDERRRY